MSEKQSGEIRPAVNLSFSLADRTSSASGSAASLPRLLLARLYATDLLPAQAPGSL